MPQPFLALRRVWRHQRVHVAVRVAVVVALSVGGTLAMIVTGLLSVWHRVRLRKARGAVSDVLSR